MKKTFLSLIFALLFGALLCVGAAGASKGKMSLSGSMSSIRHGDTVMLTVELNRNPGIKNLRCTVGYDPKVLSFVKAEGTKTLPNFSYEEKEDGVLLRWKADKNPKATGEVAHVTLRVREDAIFGDSAVTLTVDQKMYDAQNEEGEAVAFDTADLKFVLFCPHKETVDTVEQEATFESEGILKKTCTTCQNVTLQSLFPSVKSCDGRVSAEFSVGEFSKDDKVEIFVKDLYGSEEEKTARELLGKDMLFSFRIRFTKNGESYVPGKDCTVRLLSDFTLPKELVLYALMEGGAIQPKFNQTDNALQFAYDDVIFAFVSRPYVEPVIPTTTTTVTTTPPVTADPFQQERQKDLLLIVAGFVTLVLCGTGIILLLSRRNRY